MAAELPASGSGEYVLKNVGTGTYLKGDAYWGTKAVVWDDPYFVTLTYVSEGKYTIKSQQNNGGEKQYVTSGDDPYVDGASAEMTFTEVDAVNHYYTINNGNGNLYATPVTEDGADIYKVMAGEVTTDYAKWQIISRAELVAALDAASSSNPVDATFFLKDAGIDVKSVNASSWTKTNVDFEGGGNAGHSAESWNKSSFSLSQTVTDLPNGKYKVTCYGYYRWNSGSDNNNKAAIAGHESGDEVLNAKLFAGTKEVSLMSVAGDADAMTFCGTMGWDDNTPNGQWQAAACFTKGFYLNTLNDVVVTDGTLTLGVKKTTQAGTDWAVFDEFKLYYLGEDLDIYVAAYNDAVDAANAVDQSAPMLATALSALQTAISTYGTGVDETSKSALLEATSALTSATTAASNSITAYAAAGSAIETAEALQVNNNFVTAEAATTFDEAINAIKTPYGNGTLTNEAAASAGATLGVIAVGWHAEATNTPASNYMQSTWPLSIAVNDWSVEGASDGSDYLVPFFQDWIGDANSLGVKTWTGTLTGLTDGTYQVSAWVRVRAKNGTAANDATGITMDVNGGDPEDVTEGTQVGATQFQMDTYTATGYVINGTLRVNFNIAEGNNISWLSFKDVKYTRTGDLPAGYVATADDYDALNIAIAAHTLGFEDGEYAPYNNVAAATALAAAKAINQAIVNKKSDVNDATTALTGATWTANVGEVNAIYNGDFALSENDGAMAGWVTDNAAGLGGALHARAFVLTSGGNYGYLAAFGQGDGTRSCAYFRFDGTNSAKNTKYTYGSTTGYTMPLKTNTIYKLTAQAGGWGQVDKNFQIAVVSSTDANVVAQNLKTPSTGVHAGGSVIDYEMYFVVPSAGNYKLVFNNPDDVDNAVVVSNIELFSTDALEFADGSVPTYAPGTYPTVKITRALTADKWATAIYPFAVSGVDNIAVLNSYDKATGKLVFTSAAASTANEPFFMMSTSDKSEITLSNVEVAAASASPATADEASLIGAYTSTDITNAEKNYVLSDNKIYSVGDAGATINPYRAYIQISQDALARDISFVVDGQVVTGIGEIEASESTLVKDGKYLEKGNIVIYKYGKKVSATGARLF